jgi:hypothetical protein
MKGVISYALRGTAGESALEFSGLYVTPARGHVAMTRPALALDGARAFGHRPALTARDNSSR